MAGNIELISNNISAYVVPAVDCPMNASFFPISMNWCTYMLYTLLLYRVEILHLPWSITVVSESERSGTKAMKHPKDSKTGADGVATFHGDQTGNLSRCMSSY